MMQNTLHNFKSSVQGGGPAGEENCVECSASCIYVVFSIEFVLYISIYDIINSLIDHVVHQ